MEGSVFFYNSLFMHHVLQRVLSIPLTVSLLMEPCIGALSGPVHPSTTGNTGRTFAEQALVLPQQQFLPSIVEGSGILLAGMETQVLRAAPGGGGGGSED